ncbi:MAG: sulfurtransferase complex subunit TusC [Gammaproteobacteria bacterium]|nr:sulfurtransferase complex subunit TusC [Gammaproteobacteria bacterium]MYG13990.1 sulfurtransferase complex subunit TusC [Gammaproteobacteria bacterium]MYK27068.1 sulfurtransferase complex subunit TusC [Gammaproteobacteria bacterium]
MAKRILFLLNRAPYGSSYALEAIEAILVAGVFDQEVSVLFTGDGLYQLLDEQDGGAVGGRTVGKMLGAVPEYGVTDLFACRPSAERLGLGDADLCLPVTWLDYAEQRHLINRQEIVTG